MTHTELQAEVERLRAELAAKSAECSRLAQALAAKAEAEALVARAEAERKARRSAQNSAAYDRRRQIQRAESGAESRAESLPPPFPSPSLPAPISPPPISSPIPFSPPSARQELKLVPPVAAKRARKPQSPEKPTDPRHRPLLEQLVAQGWELGGARGAKAVEKLLARAGETSPGDAAVAEVLRRAGHALQKRRTQPAVFPAVAELWELVTHWQHFAEPFRAGQARGPAPPSDFAEPSQPVEYQFLDPNFGKE